MLYSTVASELITSGPLPRGHTGFCPVPWWRDSDVDGLKFDLVLSFGNANIIHTSLMKLTTFLICLCSIIHGNTVLYSTLISVFL